MTTTKSFSNNRFLAMYKTALKHQVATAIITSIICILMIPVLFFSLLSRETYYMIPNSTELERLMIYKRYFSTGVYPDFSISGLLCVLLAIVTIGAALMSNHYMHDKKRTDLYHSLPVTRKQYLLSNMAATLTAIMVPFVATYLLTMIMQLIGYSKYGCFGPQYFVFCTVDIISVLLYIFVLYVFTTLISVNVGTTFDALSITGIIGAMPSIIYMIGGAIWGSLTYGGSFSNHWAMLLSPFLFIFQRFQFAKYSSITETYIYNYRSMLLIALVWLVIGILLLVLSLYCYRRRKSELAGQTQPKGILQIACLIFAAFCGGNLFYAIFSEVPTAGLPLLMVLGAMLIGVISSIIFSRGAKQIVKHMPWMAIGGVLASALFLSIQFDLLGYERRVPTQDQVESVTISYTGRFEDLTGAYGGRFYSSYGPFGMMSQEQKDGHSYLTNPEAIATVLDAHQKAVDNPPKTLRSYVVNTDSEHYYQFAEITYKLKNGKTMTRSYNMFNAQATAALANLEDKEDFITTRHPIFFLDTLPEIAQEDLIQSVNVNDSFVSKQDNYQVLDKQNLRKLLDAVKKDMSNEKLENILSPQKPALGYLNIRYRDYTSLYGRYGNAAFLDKFNYMNGTSSVLISEEYVNTLAVLKELGLSDRIIAPKVDKYYFITMTDAGDYSDRRVNVVKSDLKIYALDIVREYKSNGLQGWYEPIKVFEVSETPEVDKISNKAKNQMYIADPMNTMVMAIAEVDGAIVGYKYLNTEDLPSNLKGEIQGYLQDKLQYGKEYMYTPTVATSYGHMVSIKPVNLDVEPISSDIIN